MRFIFLALLFILGCNGNTAGHVLPAPVHKPGPVTPVEDAGVHESVTLTAPITPMPSPEAETDESESSLEDPKLAKAGEWLMFLSSTLGLKHADAAAACEAAGGKTITGKDNEIGKFYNCDDGYQFVERGGKVVYVVDGAYPFTKGMLEELMGPPATTRVKEEPSGVKLVGYFWPIKIQQVLVIEFWEVHDPKGPSPTFVGISRPVLNFAPKSDKKHR